MHVVWCRVVKVLALHSSSRESRLNSTSLPNILTAKDHNVSETGPGSGPVIETSSFWRAQLSRSTLPHPPEDGDRSNLRDVVVFCKTSTFQTMDRVQKKPNSSVQHTPSSESFQVYSDCGLTWLASVCPYGSWLCIYNLATITHRTQSSRDCTDLNNIQQINAFELAHNSGTAHEKRANKLKYGLLWKTAFTDKETKLSDESDIHSNSFDTETNIAQWMYCPEDNTGREGGQNEPYNDLILMYPFREIMVRGYLIVESNFLDSHHVMRVKLSHANVTSFMQQRHYKITPHSPWHINTAQVRCYIFAFLSFFFFSFLLPCYPSFLTSISFIRVTVLCLNSQSVSQWNRYSNVRK
jgi:hypothetical protein